MATTATTASQNSQEATQPTQATPTPAQERAALQRAIEIAHDKRHRILWHIGNVWAVTSYSTPDEPHLVTLGDNNRLICDCAWSNYGHRICSHRATVYLAILAKRAAQQQEEQEAQETPAAPAVALPAGDAIAAPGEPASAAQNTAQSEPQYVWKRKQLGPRDWITWREEVEPPSEAPAWLRKYERKPFSLFK